MVWKLKGGNFVRDKIFRIQLKPNKTQEDNGNGVDI